MLRLPASPLVRLCLILSVFALSPSCVIDNFARKRKRLLEGRELSPVCAERHKRRASKLNINTPPPDELP